MTEDLLEYLPPEDPDLRLTQAELETLGITSMIERPSSDDDGVLEFRPRK